MFRLVQADSEAQIAQVRELFQEYAQSVGDDLCFQGFQKELAELPGGYGPPRGRLLLAVDAGQPCGCVGLRPLSGERCEMKRLYVRPAARGRGLGRLLVLEVLRQAESLGYGRMVLDTLPVMAAARALYASLGFQVVAAPGTAADSGQIFMERVLPRPAPRRDAAPDE